MDEISACTVHNHALVALPAKLAIDILACMRKMAYAAETTEVKKILTSRELAKSGKGLFLYL